MPRALVLYHSQEHGNTAAMAEAVAQNMHGWNMVVLAGNGHIIQKFGVPNRAYARTHLPFRTIYLAPVGGKAELSYGDYVWVTP